MSFTKEYCNEHEEIKACSKGIITWPKFITFMISIIVIAVSTTSIITSNIFGAIASTDKKASTRATEIEQSSIIRDKDIVIELKQTMEKYIIPMNLSLTRIEERLKLNNEKK